MNNKLTADVGLTRAISIIYILFCVSWILAVFLNIEIAGLRMNWKTDIWLPVFWLLVSVGTLRRTKWGRWLSYPISSVLLLGVPFGTLLGGFMLWHLTKYRAAFNKWY